MTGSKGRALEGRSLTGMAGACLGQLQVELGPELDGLRLLEERHHLGFRRISVCVSHLLEAMHSGLPGVMCGGRDLGLAHWPLG